MMGLLSLFRRAPDQDYETLLSQLETKIQSRQARLQTIQLRERRATALTITWGLGVWVVYVALWYFYVFRQNAVNGVPVIGGPVVIFFTRRLLRWWYSRKKEGEETRLRELKKQQRDKVEELKKKTGYYSTRQILEKYDEVVKKNAEERGLKLSVPPSATGPSGTPHRPASAGPLGPNARANTNPTQPSIRLPGSPASAAGTPSRQQFPAPPLPAAPTGPPPPPPQRTLLDKFADALLGMPYDPNTRYALICANCFTHNGLVPKEQWEGIQYRCLSCGFYNPTRTGPASPAPPPGTNLGVPGEGGHRRRVQSMHHLPLPSALAKEGLAEGVEEGASGVGLGVPSGSAGMSQRSVSGPARPGRQLSSKPEESEEEEEEEMAEREVLMEEKKAGREGARRRVTRKEGEEGEDRMETD